MASLLSMIVLATAAIPLGIGWRAARGTSLRHALAWAGAAYLLALFVAFWNWRAGYQTRWNYASLSLCLCPLVALLGARKPGVSAWNFVVAGLLAVLGLALVDASRGAVDWRLDGPRTVFVSIVLVVAVINYLPTEQWLAALIVGIGCGCELMRLSMERAIPTEYPSTVSLAVPLAAWLVYFRLAGLQRDRASLDADWRRFRDSFGVVWSKPVQEQFNLSAANGGMRARLSWFGFEPNEVQSPLHAGDLALARELFRSLTKRFVDYR